MRFLSPLFAALRSSRPPACEANSPVRRAAASFDRRFRRQPHKPHSVRVASTLTASMPLPLRNSVAIPASGTNEAT